MTKGKLGVLHKVVPLTTAGSFPMQNASVANQLDSYK